MFEKRYLSILTVIFVFGIGSAIALIKFDTYYLRALISVLFVVSSVLSVRLLKKVDIRHNESKTATALLALAVFCLGFFRVWLYGASVYGDMKYDKVTDEASFIVVKSYGNYCYADVTESKSDLPKLKKVKFYTNEPLKTGEKFRASVTYRFNLNNKDLAEGVRLTANGYVTERTGGDILFGIRDYISKSCDDMYSGFDNGAALSKTVLIGDRTDMNGYLYSVFGNAGMSHVLAISGMHIAVVSMSFFAVFHKIGVHKRVCSVIGSVLALVYSLIVGYSPSVIRAAVMIIFTLILESFFNGADTVNIMFRILLVFVLINPFSLCSVSLLLSFSCTFGLLVVGPLIKNRDVGSFRRKDRADPKKVLKHHLTEKFLNPAEISMAAAIFSFPVVFFSFDTFSYITPITNVLLVPLFSLGIEIGIYSIVLYPIWSFLGKAAAFVAGNIFSAVTKISEWLYSLGIGRLSVGTPYMVIPLAFALITVYLLVKQKYNYQKRSFISVCCMVVSIIVIVVANRVYMNDRVIFESSPKVTKYVYVQSGDENCYFDIGGYVSTDSVFKNGNVKLDKYVITEPTKGALNRFKNMSESMNIGEVYIPDTDDTEQNFIITEIKELANRRNCDIIIYYKALDIEFSKGNKVFLSFDGGVPFVEYKDNNHSVTQTFGKYGGAVFSDVFVLTDTYSGDFGDIYAENIAMYSEKNPGTAEPNIYYDDIFSVTFKQTENKGYVYGHR